MIELSYTETFYGKFYHIKNDMWISSAISQNKMWEDHIYKYITSRFKKDDELFIVDAGAHIGTFSIPVLLHFDNSKCIAIEAVDEFCSILNKNIAANSLQNRMSTVNSPISYEPNISINMPNIDKIFSQNVNNYGGLSLKNKSFDGVIKKTISIDSLELKNLNVLKMDVENMEKELIIGAKKTILKFKPIILFESHEEYLSDVSDILINLGYKIDKVHPMYKMDYVAVPL